ncbi:MAG: hypothetical protein JWN51_1374, partial [Phycisphaerales bacterium]|nr:hypothetical protein [Phycisphaerales bacterium]
LPPPRASGNVFAMQMPNQPGVYPPAYPPAEKRKFGAFSALVLSFFSPGLYRDVARRWRGFGFWYLVMLMFLTAIPIAVKAHYSFQKFVKDEATPLFQTFPDISMANGKVSIAEEEPYLWRDLKTGQVILYVDTTDAFDLPEGRNAAMRLGKSTIAMKQANGQTQTNDLTPLQPFHVNKATAQNALDRFAPVAGPVVFGVVFIFPVIGHLIQILIYAVIGLLICLMFNAQLSFGALMRLAAVAITPAILLSTGLSMAGVSLPAEGLIFFVIEMAFLGFAVKANGEERLPPTGGFPIQPQYAGYYPQQQQYPPQAQYPQQQPPQYPQQPPQYPPPVQPPRQW